MTSAPGNLLAVRSLLLTHLDNQPGDDLEPAELGVVGDAAHIGEGDSYHLGSPEQNPSGRYSILESSRDRYSLTAFASALDVGEFSVTTPKGWFDLAHFSRWCVAQCAAGTVDTRDIREIIYSPDGKIVKRWDRLGIRSTGDSSHLWHTHFSFFRDATKANRDQTPLFRRYLTTIGLIELEEPDMTPEEGRQAAFLGVYDALNQAGNRSTVEGRFMSDRLEQIITPRVKAQTDPLRLEVTGLRSVVDGIVTQLSTGSGSVDVAAILAGVDAAVQLAAESIKAEARDAVADLGEGGAAQVRADLG